MNPMQQGGEERLALGSICEVQLRGSEGLIGPGKEGGGRVQNNSELKIVWKMAWLVLSPMWAWGHVVQQLNKLEGPSAALLFTCFLTSSLHLTFPSWEMGRVGFSTSLAALSELTHEHSLAQSLAHDQHFVNIGSYSFSEHLLFVEPPLGSGD